VTEENTMQPVDYDMIDDSAVQIWAADATPAWVRDEVGGPLLKPFFAFIPMRYRALIPPVQMLFPDGAHRELGDGSLLVAFSTWPIRLG
jgi:hypothetical protein